MPQKHLALIAVCVVAFVTYSASVSAQTAGTPNADRMGRSKPGEKMVVVLYFVKADKKQQFEDCLNRIWEALDKVSASDATMKRVNVQTRVLFPHQGERGRNVHVCLPGGSPPGRCRVPCGEHLEDGHASKRG